MNDTGHPPGSRRLDITPAALDDVLPWRERYREEMRCQIVHDSYHARGFTDSYAFHVDGVMAGYGSLAGDPHPPRTIVKEFYVSPTFRDVSYDLMLRLIRASGAKWVDAQTNDLPIVRMLDRLTTEIETMNIVFADVRTTNHSPPNGATFRQLGDADRSRVFEHAHEGVGDWCVEVDNEIVATGGLMFHYNPPYADLYMEVAPQHRHQGYGSYLVQELKRVAHEGGSIPAARCRPDNTASLRTLQRAGMLPCARILRGRIPLDLV